MSKLNGLSTINIELTSRCNKNCWMCGRRKIERDFPELVMDYGDMNFNMIKNIANQLPPNIVVQFHSNGEPLLYPRLGEAICLYKKQITSFDTNGKLLVKRADEIIDKLDTMAISIFKNDTEEDEQYEIIEKFMKIKGDKKPYVILRLNGEVDCNKYSNFDALIVKRLLHSPMGSFEYKKRNPTIPEIGICLDFLHHLSINKDGKVSICVRFDLKGLGVIGDIAKESLDNIWNGEKRLKWLKYHKEGNRKKIPLCSYCDFWGVPTGI